MQTPFEYMPGHSRVWVYQANRTLNAAELSLAEQALLVFTEDWNSHGHGLKSSYKTFFNKFLVVAVDETAYGASGCSIDKSVNLMKELEQQLNVKLLDKMQIAYLADGQIATLDLKEIKAAVADGTITPETIIFNNLVDSIEKLNSQWQQKAADSWLARYFQKVV